MLDFILFFCSRNGDRYRCHILAELCSARRTSVKTFETDFDDDSKHSTTAPSLLTEFDRDRTSARATGCCSNYV